MLELRLWWKSPPTTSGALGVLGLGRARGEPEEGARGGQSTLGSLCAEAHSLALALELSASQITSSSSVTATLLARWAGVEPEGGTVPPLATPCLRLQFLSLALLFSGLLGPSGSGGQLPELRLKMAPCPVGGGTAGGGVGREVGKGLNQWPPAMTRGWSQKASNLCHRGRFTPPSLEGPQPALPVRAVPVLEAGRESDQAPGPRTVLAPLRPGSLYLSLFGGCSLP